MTPFKTLVFFALLLLSKTGFSQSKLEEGPEQAILADYKYKGIYGADDKGFYAYRILEKKVGPKVSIEKYDSKTLSRIILNEITLPQQEREFYSSDAHACHIEVRFLNQITFIFYSLFNDDEKKCSIYCITVDKTGNASAPKLLSSDNTNYVLITSPDQLHFGLICYTRTGKPEANDADYNNFYDGGEFKFYNTESVSQIFSKPLEDITKNRKVERHNYVVDNNGTLSYFITEFANAQDLFLKRLSKWEIAVIPFNKTFAQHLSLNFPAPPNYMNSEISYHLEVLPSGDAFATFAVFNHDFATKTFNTTNISEVVSFKDEKNIAFDQKILDFKGGSFYAILSKEYNGNLYAFFNGIKFLMLSKIAKDGSMEWYKIFPKSIETRPELFKTIDFKILFMDGKINLYYVDHPKNTEKLDLNSFIPKEVATAGPQKGSNVICISVNEKGLAQREVIFTNDEFSILPTGFDSELNKAPYLRLYSKTTEKFARLK